MEVMNVRTARAIWLIEVGDLNPRGLSLYPLLFGIKERYRFQVYPKAPEDVTSPDGVKFRDGMFSVDNQAYGMALTIHNDGFVVDTQASTRICDSFLEDLLGFASSQLGGTYRSDLIRRKLYASELILRTDVDLGNLLSGLLALSKKLSELANTAFRPVGFELGCDPEGPNRRDYFRLERQIGIAFDQSRYYSVAPLQTDDHIALLEEFERIARAS